MRRGEVWTIAGGADYAGKPRPAVIVQSDLFDATNSITVCPFTTTTVNGDPVRIAITASSRNGLFESSQIMIDKITSLPKTKLGRRLGLLEKSELAQLNRNIALYLGIGE